MFADAGDDGVHLALPRAINAHADRIAQSGVCLEIVDIMLYCLKTGLGLTFVSNRADGMLVQSISKFLKGIVPPELVWHMASFLRCENSSGIAVLVMTQTDYTPARSDIYNQFLPAWKSSCHQIAFSFP